MQRRRFMQAGGGALVAIAAQAAAAPVLSPDNFGLTARSASRRNGWIEVDAQAFEANVLAVRQLLGPVGLCAVMKADAYGNGIALLMPSIRKLGITEVAITANDEARVARALGYRGRLLRIRAAAPVEMEDGLTFGIEEIIANADAAQRLALMWRKRGGRKPLPVQLALNSGGMSRNGLELSCSWGKADARALLGIGGLSVCGVMTHYPSEAADDILAQLARFEADIAWLQAEGLLGKDAVRHTANSFATLEHPTTRLDMVRVGGLLYGDPGSVKTDAFAPTITIKSRVAAVNHFPAGQTVNYDRTYRLERESWLANIPMGYSDGYRRAFSHANRPEFASEVANQTEVLIGGRRFPLVGRVTMNTLLADVTGFQDAIALGDEVVLFGAQGLERITQGEFERNSASYGPEILSVLGATLPRVLASQGKARA
ncbi:alanine racemase [Novosphingobium sp. ERN07]|uniref:alanine racemase n=1 Tax=Novosphingobium sp. ERN07 TaxID=2726187 RepID=UPI0014572517|nr:alanine racemase [Novosphingobium sp. ERN07]NLR72970.1 alanine racemase [Novosphingobium sp. ERN07]